MLHNTVWSGNAHPLLAKIMAGYLEYPLWPIPVQSFADGEISIQIPGKKVSDKPLDSIIIVQSLCPPVNHHLMELLMMIDAAHNAGCKQITVVIPYFAYAREDRSAKLIADLLATRPINHMITLDLHHSELENVFSKSLKIPLEHIESTALFAESIQKYLLKPLIVSPDLGGAHRAQKLAKSLKADFIILNKKTKNLCALAQKRFCIIVDDIVDTGKTLYNATRFLKEQGASQVIAYATHGVLSKDTLETLLSLEELERLILTDSIPLSLSNQHYLNNNPNQAKKLEILSVALLLSKATQSHPF